MAYICSQVIRRWDFEPCVSESELYLSRISTPRAGYHRSKAWAELPASVAYICRRVISTQAGDMCGNVLAVYLRRSNAERTVSTHKKALRLATFLAGIHAATSQSTPPASLQSRLRYLRRKGTAAESNGTSFRASAVRHRHCIFAKETEYDSSSRSQAQAMTITRNMAIGRYVITRWAQFPGRMTYVGLEEAVGV